MIYQLLEGDIQRTIRTHENLHGCVDVIVTSPPYNLGKKYGDGVDDKLKPAAYLDWMQDCLSVMRMSLRENGSLFLNIGGSPSDPMKPLQVLEVAQRMFKVQNIIHWVKSIALPTKEGEHTYGHFKPINSPRFLNDTHEYIFHLTNTGKVELDRKAEGVGTTYSDASNMKRWKHTGGGNMRCRGNTWFMPYKTIQSRDKHRPHPAPFPVELAERCIRLHGHTTGSVVMDPFLGLGNSGVAAARCGAREFIGIDIVPEFIDLSSASIDEAIEESSILSGGAK